jgi:two-component system response regulator QseB/two-component system response regulator BasR
MNILFVEDNVNASRAMKVMLELKGYSVDVAANVADALECIASSDYDLLISDITLPDGTGYDILARSPKRIPAIALSGHTAESARAESLARGFAEHVTKPFQTEELIELIERVAAT